MSRLQSILLPIATVTVALLLHYAILQWLNMPVVKKSATTSACAEVISDDSAFSCDKMPKKYHTVWVQ